MKDFFSRYFVYAVFGLFAGIYFFFKGFKILWKKRLIQNIPTSTIRAIPMGLVEIKGNAIGKRILKAPLSKIPCVYYRYIEEQLTKDTRGNYKWIKILDVKSDIPFYLKDETGCVLVDPKDAETNLVAKYTKMEGNIRKKEFFIIENEKIYVLGTAKKTETIYDIEEREVERKMAEIMKNPEEKIKLDLNKDMWIDKEEFEKVKEKIREEVRKELRKKFKKEEDTMVSPHLKNVVIGRGENDPIFIISTQSEKDLIEKFRNKAIFYIFGGSLLFLFCLGVVVFTLPKIIKNLKV